MYDSERNALPGRATGPRWRTTETIEYADADTLLDDLPTHLRALQRACASASAAVTARYFDQTMPVTWAHEGV